MTASETFIGVDIGGTKTAVGVVDAAGVLLRTIRHPTPRSGATAVLAATAQLICEVAAGADITAIGVGAPGVVDAAGTVVSATDVLPGWTGAPVAAYLAGETGRPVVVDNDVRVMAYAEVQRGAARDADTALHVSVGTGIGGALTRRGELGCGALDRGAHGVAGALAHLLVPATGAIACGCGRRDHLEAVTSGPAIAAAFAARTGADPVGLADIARLAADGNADAARAITDAATLLGRALAGIQAVVDVDVIVLGGGVTTIGAAFVDPVRNALRAEALPPLRETPVVTAALGTEAPLIGAALLARDCVATAVSVS